ncbi:MAG TPA: 3-oxoacyl-ACP reductase FabG [Solirubrobacteraceae bacterium]|jgi:3-oxoacyl-[acyl-carrier protein] reductase|nr:3-oxoacyl-ACP reductase FabG [Solirubrobacteraceae bacterium]
MSAGRLDRQVAVVTGAGNGIGRAIAVRLAAAGAAVVVNDLDPAAGADTVAAIVSSGGHATAAPGNVSDPTAVREIVAGIEATHGTLDILVNNAGVTRDAPVQRMSDDDWRVVQEVGLWGSFYMCRAASPLLRGQRDQPPGHHRKVVNMSSSVGIYGAPGTANYAAAKAGLIGLTKTLAREWARYRINVNAVAPGLIAGTRLTAGKPAELIARVEAQVPLGRAGTPEDVAGAVAFLVSEDADYITGQVLELHGGLEIPV